VKLVKMPWKKEDGSDVYEPRPDSMNKMQAEACLTSHQFRALQRPLRRISRVPVPIFRKGKLTIQDRLRRRDKNPGEGLTTTNKEEMMTPDEYWQNHGIAADADGKPIRYEVNDLDEITVKAAGANGVKQECCPFCSAPRRKRHIQNIAFEDYECGHRLMETRQQEAVSAASERRTSKRGRSLIISRNSSKTLPLFTST
jgi:hypothetical protein